MPYMPFYDQDEEDPGEYDKYGEPDLPPAWPPLEPFDGPDFDDEVPF